MRNFEVIKPFLNFSGLDLPTVYRSKIERERYYFANIDGQFVRMPSVTTILQHVMPMESWLIQWIAKWGYERAIEKRNQAAHYGTLFSMCVAEFLKKAEFDLEALEVILDGYRYNNKIDFPTDFWEVKLREDLYAISEFFQDYQFDPIFAELPLVSKKYEFAGTVDAVGWLTIGSGMNGKILKRDIVRNKDNEIVENKTRKVLAIIDWKTGKHGFYRSHEAQLHMYKLLVEENFPEIAEKYEIRLYNWAPKEWENEDDAKYTFKDQTESKEALKILNYIALFKVDHKDYEPKIKIINGKLRINQKNGNLRIMPYKEILAQRNNNSNSKEEQSLEPNAIPANDLPEDVLTAIGSIFENLKQKEGEQQ